MANVTMKQYRHLWNLDLLLRPVFLPGIMKDSGNTSPVTLPQKARFLYQDLYRSAKWFGIVDTYQSYPTNSFTRASKENLTFQRFIAAAISHGSLSDADMVDAAFRAFWQDKTRRDSEDNLVSRASQRLLIYPRP